ADAAVESRCMKAAALCDVSCWNRFGIKGPGAAAWLAAQGMELPEHANRWAMLHDGALLARLGNSEFFVEDGFTSQTGLRLKEAYASGIPEVYTVPRQDAAVVLGGDRLDEIMSELCAVDLARLGAREVAMALLAGVAVVMIRTELHGAPVYRVWCDGTYGPYLWEALLEAAQDCGGGAVGIGSFYPGQFER
ncbi:MAG: hypothetical protein ACREUA_04785, partial [Burkholderiales bacterium]